MSSIGEARDAIDHCLKQLSPHTHLNSVALHPDGALMIQDQRLPTAELAPRPYSSSGQLTCLALALFFDPVQGPAIEPHFFGTKDQVAAG